jgi:hypothetical protein
MSHHHRKIKPPGSQVSDQFAFEVLVGSLSQHGETDHSGMRDETTYCTVTALRRKSLIMNGAGEGNRTLVNIP